MKLKNLKNLRTVSKRYYEDIESSSDIFSSIPGSSSNKKLRIKHSKDRKCTLDSKDQKVSKGFVSILNIE